MDNVKLRCFLCLSLTALILSPFFGKSATNTTFANAMMMMKPSSSSSRRILRILFHGGDNMLGRAVQLTFPVQAPGEEDIMDSCTANYYLQLSLQHPSESNEYAIDEIRRWNAHQGSYLWGYENGHSPRNHPTSIIGDGGGSSSISPPPDVRILNLETAVTRSIHNRDIPTYKGINYHAHVDNMNSIFSGFVHHPMHGDGANTPTTSIKTATKASQPPPPPPPPPSPVVISFANNHIMDFGRQALEQETLPFWQQQQQQQDGVQMVGCGLTWREAARPVVVSILPSFPPQHTKEDPGKKATDVDTSDTDTTTTTTTSSAPSSLIEIFAFSTGCSGTPSAWWATDERSGLVGLPSLNHREHVRDALVIAKRAFHQSETNNKNKKPQEQQEQQQQQQQRKIRVVSIHWGPNWAYRFEEEEEVDARREFARRLIDECNVDLIYGHSSHHARGLEVYHGKLIMYGAGDIINDYEGFENLGEERYNRLGGIYLADIDSQSGELVDLKIVPMFMDRLRLKRWTPESKIWRPKKKRLEGNPNLGKEFCNFINLLSEKDDNDVQGALRLVYQEEDPQLPGGPILHLCDPVS